MINSVKGTISDQILIFFSIVPVADQKHLNFIIGTEEELTTEFTKKPKDLMKSTRNLNLEDLDLIFCMTYFD